jgi:hypothetical protein
VILAILENFKCKIKEKVHDNNDHEEVHKDIGTLKQQIKDPKE